MTYCFPKLEAPDLVGYLNSYGIECTETDFRSPKRDRWQALYTELLGLAVGTDANEMSNYLHQPMITSLTSQQYPSVHEEATPLFNLCRCMQRVLFACGIEDFNLQDIVEPRCQRLKRVCSALINFINFRGERMVEYETIKEQDENIKKQREVLMDENEDLQKKINAIKANRAEKEPHVQQILSQLPELTDEAEAKNNAITQLQRDIADSKAGFAEQKAQLSRVKEQLAAAKEEGVKLSSQIVQSPEKMKGETERMENRLRDLQWSKEEKLSKLVDLQAKCKTITRPEDLTHAYNLMQKIQQNVNQEKALCVEIAKLSTELAHNSQELTEARTKEQFTSRKIGMKEGKANKQKLQHQSKIGDLKHTLERLTKEREHLLSERGEEEQIVRDLLAEQQALAQKDAHHAQKHSAQLNELRSKYKQLLQHVDAYHTRFAKCIMDTKAAIQ